MGVKEVFASAQLCWGAQSRAFFPVLCEVRERQHIFRAACTLYIISMAEGPVKVTPAELGLGPR